jgi:hypothetical protein
MAKESMRRRKKFFPERLEPKHALKHDMKLPDGVTHAYTSFAPCLETLLLTLLAGPPRLVDKVHSLTQYRGPNTNTSFPKKRGEQLNPCSATHSLRASGLGVSEACPRWKTCTTCFNAVKHSKHMAFALNAFAFA